VSTSVATPIVHPTAPLSANQIAQQQFDRIADRLGLDQATRNLLRAPMRAVPHSRTDGGRNPRERERVTLRDAAYMIGVGRVAEASRLRGWV
jgi:hypothetical protein